ncbi:hypothetical protein HEQ72_06845 [Haematospirillum sp. 15-248]|nr:hypothetical protein [Haematospirillum sp. 15-248]NKD88024.1 hypothetical protein [Haematospirillum sp. 15-248]
MKPGPENTGFSLLRVPFPPEGVRQSAKIRALARFLLFNRKILQHNREHGVEREKGYGKKNV